MFWEQIIDAERSYLDLVSARLLTLHQQGQRSGHADVKYIYAGGKAAHDKAQEALDALIRDSQELSRSGHAGQLPERMQALAATASPPRRRALCTSMQILRCMKPRPSDVFREEMRRQGWAFMKRVHGLLQDASIPDGELQDYIEGIGELLCGLELFEDAALQQGEEKKRKSWVPGLLKASAVAIGTWKARDLWEGRSTTKRSK